MTATTPTPTTVIHRCEGLQGLLPTTAYPTFPIQVLPIPPAGHVDECLEREIPEDQQNVTKTHFDDDCKTN